MHILFRVYERKANMSIDIFKRLSFFSFAQMMQIVTERVVRVR